MSAAREAHQRPTAALLNLPDPNMGWTDIDYTLQTAMYILEKDICPKCGNPVWYCHSSDNRIEFEVETGTCYGEAAIDELGKDAKLGPGEFYIVKAVGLKNEDGTYDPLPSRREALEKI